MTSNKEQLKLLLKQIGYQIAQNSNTEMPKEAMTVALEISKCIITFKEILEEKILEKNTLNDDEMYVFEECLEKESIEKISKAPSYIQDNVIKFFNIIKRDDLSQNQPFNFIPEVVRTFDGILDGKILGIKVGALKATQAYMDLLQSIMPLMIKTIKVSSGMKDEELKTSLDDVNKNETGIGGEIKEDFLSMSWGKSDNNEKTEKTDGDK